MRLGDPLRLCGISSTGFQPSEQIAVPSLQPLKGLDSSFGGVVTRNATVAIPPQRAFRARKNAILRETNPRLSTEVRCGLSTVELPPNQKYDNEEQRDRHDNSGEFHIRVSSYLYHQILIISLIHSEEIAEQAHRNPHPDAYTLNTFAAPSLASQYWGYHGAKS